MKVEIEGEGESEDEYTKSSQLEVTTMRGIGTIAVQITSRTARES